MLFEENESNIAALYSLYAQKIPEKQAFWNQLSNEEIAHAVQIGNKKDIPDTITENKFSRSVIKYVMDFVLEETKKAQQNEISHHDALLTALRIERSILEKKCFNMFSPTDDKVKNVLNKINHETERHVKILTKEMKLNNFPFKD